MDKQAISKKIIEDAQNKAQAILQKAQDDADLLIAQAQSNAKNMIAQAEEQAKKEGELLIERRKTLARLDAKKVILDCKQALILRAFAFAQEKLNTLSKEDYLKFIEKQVENHAEKGDLLLLCASAPVLEEEVCNLPAVKKLSLDVKRGESFGGGIKLLGSKCDKDLSFGAIVSEYAKSNAQEISARIFK